MASPEQPSRAWGYPRRSERPRGKERLRPHSPFPQFVWLTRHGSGGDEVEADGSPYRELSQCQLGARLYREWKAEAPELQLLTLYYVADNITDPGSGRDLAVIHHRVDKHSCVYGFHSRIEVLNPLDHSPRLLELVRERRDDNHRREVPPSPPIGAYPKEGADGFGDMESSGNCHDAGGEEDEEAYPFMEDGEADKYVDAPDDDTIEYPPREVLWWAPQ